MNRRGYFKMLLGEGLAWKDEVCGLPQLRIANLQDLPKHVFSQIVPALLGGIEIDLRQGQAFCFAERFARGNIPF